MYCATAIQHSSGIETPTIKKEKKRYENWEIKDDDDEGEEEEEEDRGNYFINCKSAKALKLVCVLIVKVIIKKEILVFTLQLSITSSQSIHMKTAVSTGKYLNVL